MNDDQTTAEGPTAKGLDAAKVHAACIEHADDLLRVATHTLYEAKLPHIAYHLATLALEEIGKAGFIASRHVMRDAKDTSWIDRRLDDHPAKLMWALWLPAFGSKTITPKEFEEAREFAKSIHENRLKAIYVPTEMGNGNAVVPRAAVNHRRAETLLELAKVRVDIERGKDLTQADTQDELLQWFLDATADQEKARLLFSKGSIEKLAEFKSDVRRWVAWVKEEFDKADANARAAMQRELARSKPVGDEADKDKWRVRVRIYSASHSIRAKVLNTWPGNEWIKLMQGMRKSGKSSSILPCERLCPFRGSGLWHGPWRATSSPR